MPRKAKNAAAQEAPTAQPKSIKKTTLKAVEKAIERKNNVYIPTHDDPVKELRLLTMKHKSLSRRKQTIESTVRDRTIRKGPDAGKIIPCELDPMTRHHFLILTGGVKDFPPGFDTSQFKFPRSITQQIKDTEAQMLKTLKQVPIYQELLKDVFGLGPVVCSYLISEIDIYKAVKPSAINQFCGMSVINGRLIRRTKGQKNNYNSGLRVRLYQFATAMLKNASPKKHGGKNMSSKYLQAWANKKTQMMNRAEPATRGAAHSAGWHVAMRIFLEDMYIVWRTMEGLPIWPDYNAGKLGYAHGGKIVVNEPRLLTLEQAKELVGHVGKFEVEFPLAVYNAKDDDAGLSDEELEDFEAIEALDDAAAE